MKKIFHILMSAVVALGVVACDNEIDDNLGGNTGESVSITVTLNDATKVALADNGLVEGKQTHKIVFEEGDQLFVFAGSGHEAEGYYFEYTKPEGEDTYVFTCSAEGVSAIVGTYQYIYYQGGREGAMDAFGNYADQTIKGVFIEGYGKIGTTPIAMKMAPVLKFKSAYPVLIEASNWVFNGYKRATSVDTENWVYISTHGAYTIDITATINGKPAWVKGVNGAEDKATGTLTLAMEYNKIYNLGELIPEPVIADVANIEIDGDFSDWEAVTNCVATLPDGVSYTAATLIKGYADANYLYVYVEYDPTNVNKMSMFIDPDYSNATGCTGNWGMNGSSLLLEDGDVTVDTAWGPSANTYAGTDGADEWSWTWFWNGQIVYTHVPVVLKEGEPTVGMEIKLDKQKMNVTLGENVGVGMLMQNGSSKVGRIPASTSGSGAAQMLLIPNVVE